MNHIEEWCIIEKKDSYAEDIIMCNLSAFKKCFLFFCILFVPCLVTTDLFAKSVEEWETENRSAISNINKFWLNAHYISKEQKNDELNSALDKWKETKVDNASNSAERMEAVINNTDDLSSALKGMYDAMLRGGQISEDEYKKAISEIEDSFDALNDYKKYQDKEAKAKEKAAEKKRKAAEKVQKKQNKLADKAEKQLDKLAKELEECEAMVATPEKRQACAEKAKKKYGLSDEEAAALTARQAQKAAQESVKQMQDKLDKEREEQVAKEDQISGVEQKEGSKDDPNKDIGISGNADGTGGNTTGLKGVCANAGSGNTKVFAQIACKAMMFLIDLRIIAYVISGFGMVAFAYAAVFNKISWKHFSQIAIGLFLLAMIGPFITYFTGDKTVEINLQYGNYLGGSYNPIKGTESKKNFDIDDGMLPEVTVTAQKRKWNWKTDLVGSIKSGLNTVRGAYNTVQGVKSTLNTVKNNADIIKNAITNNGDGLDGILGAVGNISGAMNNIGSAYSTGMSNMLSGIDNVANNAQDMTATQQQRNINAKERAAGGESNLISSWINSEEGGKSLEKDFAQMNNIINKGATVAGKATTAGHEGQKIGGGALGDVLGGLMGAGEAIVGADDAKAQVQKEKEIEAQRQKEQEAWNKSAEAAKKQQEENRRHAEEVQRRNQQQDEALYKNNQGNKLFDK